MFACFRVGGEERKANGTDNVSVRTSVHVSLSVHSFKKIFVFCLHNLSDSFSVQGGPTNYK